MQRGLDPKVLQEMVLDLMSQLDREFTERNKIEARNTDPSLTLVAGIFETGTKLFELIYKDLQYRRVPQQSFRRPGRPHTDCECASRAHIQLDFPEGERPLAQ